jgi:hypothetical protein
MICDIGWYNYDKIDAIKGMFCNYEVVYNLIIAAYL